MIWNLLIPIKEVYSIQDGSIYKELWVSKVQPHMVEEKEGGGGERAKVEIIARV